MLLKLSRHIRHSGNVILQSNDDSEYSVVREYHCRLLDRLIGAIEQRWYASDDFRHHRAKWRGITGWLTESQAEWLFAQAVDSTLSGNVVEIGSAWGRSSVCLGLGLRVAAIHNEVYSKVYCVDPHTGSEGFRNQLQDAAKEFSSLDGFKRNVNRFDLQDYVIPIVASSEDAAKHWTHSPIKLLFIDGWHSFDAVCIDILGWVNFMVPNGIIVLHDYHHAGVRNAIDYCMEQLGIGKEELQKIDSQMVYFRMPPTISYK